MCVCVALARLPWSPLSLAKHYKRGCGRQKALCLCVALNSSKCRQRDLRSSHIFVVSDGSSSNTTLPPVSMRSLPEGLRPPAYPCWSSLTGFWGVFGCRFPSRSQGRCFSALSESLDVSVLLAQYRYLVLEQNGVQSHLRMDQGHRAKPAGKFVHARLPLGKVVRVCPTRRPGCLRRREGQHFRNVLLALKPDSDRLIILISCILYLSHHRLLVLFLLSDLDRRHLSDSRHQEVHEDVFTVWELVNHSLQAAGQVVCVQVVIIPGLRKDDALNTFIRYTVHVRY